MTPSEKLLKQCGWLSVQQLAVYHSVVMVYKVMLYKYPNFFYFMFSTKYSYQTNQTYSRMLRQI